MKINPPNEKIFTQVPIIVDFFNVAQGGWTIENHDEFSEHHCLGLKYKMGKKEKQAVLTQLDEHCFLMRSAIARLSIGRRDNLSHEILRGCLMGFIGNLFHFKLSKKLEISVPFTYSTLEKFIQMKIGELFFLAGLPGLQQIGICTVCATAFVRRRRDSKYCDGRCKQYAYDEKKRLKIPLHKRRPVGRPKKRSLYVKSQKNPSPSGIAK